MPDQTGVFSYAAPFIGPTGIPPYWPDSTLDPKRWNNATPEADRVWNQAIKAAIDAAQANGASGQVIAEIARLIHP